MSPPTKLLLGTAVFVCAQFAMAQKNLGELLDAGAIKLSAEEFRQKLVGRVIAGPTQTGNTLELVYISDGVIRGAGFGTFFGTGAGGGRSVAVEGTWTIDERERICASMRMGEVVLPSRCQSWFIYGDQYFISDSDSDRSARVLARTLKN